MDNAKRISFILKVGHAAALLAVVWFVWRHLLGCFIPFWMGLLLASVFKPVITWLSRLNHTRRKGVTYFVLVMFYLSVGLGLWLLAVWLAGKLGLALRQLPGFYESYLQPAFETIRQNVAGLLSFLPGDEASQLELWSGELGAQMAGMLTDLSAQMLAGAAALIKRAPLLLITFVFSIISSVLISFDYEQVVGFLGRQLPQSWRPVLRESRNFAFTILPKLFRAYGILLSITFCELLAGFWLLGFPGAFGLAAGIALFDILPLLGLGGILLPWCAALFLMGSTVKGVGLLALYLGIALLRNFIEPKVIGGQIGLHPLATLTAMYAGLRVGGFLGMLAAPVLVMYLLHLHKAGLLGPFEGRDLEPPPQR